MNSRITPFFNHEKVVVVGASAKPGKPGNVVLQNILANNYQGDLYLVNPSGGEIYNMPLLPSINDLPDSIEVAIVVVPANSCPKVVNDCAKKGIQSIVLLAGGFAEYDDFGHQIQKELEEIIDNYNLTVLGPNTSGYISTPNNFAPSLFPLGKIRRGNISYLAQTGNFATHTMKHILTSENFGVARVIGLGNKIDVDESDALEYLSKDPETNAVLMYLESFKRPQDFIKIAREASQHKPIVVLKSGSTEVGKNAAIAHTAALAAEDRLVDGLLKQAGVVRIWDYTHLVLAGKALSMVPLPRGNRVGFLAPSGAMLVVLSDLCVRLGLAVPELGDDAINKLTEISPPFLRMRNPVDIWGAATVKGIEIGYREGMEALLQDPNIDAVVPILMLTEETGIPSYDFIIKLRNTYPQKPILVTYSGDENYMRECKKILEPEGIPTFPEIEQPFEVLSILYRCWLAMSRNG